jgi:ubiquinone biosynthesis protein
MGPANVRRRFVGRFCQAGLFCGGRATRIEAERSATDNSYSLWHYADATTLARGGERRLSATMRISSIPQIYRHVNRWREILAVLSKYGLAGWLSRLEIGFAKDLLKDRDGQALSSHSGETRIRLAMTELGPAFIKLGQILSTRADLVGPELAEELSLLQADAPADPPEQIRQRIEEELGRPIDEVFDSFDDEPLASASIGQVHAAQLKSGESVVVKVMHTDIERRVSVDLDVMSGLSQLAEKIPEFQNYRPQATFAEFRRMMRRELDFGRELRNMDEFEKAFSSEPTVCIPKPYPEYSTGRVLTMQRLDGVKLTDVDELDRRGVDRAEVARRGANLYLEMIFTLGVYHADPHPGNMLVLDDNVIGLLDFGMVGRIDDQLRDDFEGMMLALGSRDATHLTTLITRIGSTPPELDTASLSVDVTDFVTHYANQPVDQVSLSGALNEMTEIMRRYHIMLPARAAMLLKVIVMLEGTSRLLSPNFSLMEVMRPHQKRMLLRRLSPARQAKKMRRIFRELEYLAETLPRRVLDLVGQIESGRFDVHLDHRGLEPSVNRLVMGLLASALFLGSSLMISREVLAIWSVSVPGACGAFVSVAMGLRLFRAIAKSGHLDRRKK